MRQDDFRSQFERHLFERNLRGEFTDQRHPPLDEGEMAGPDRRTGDQIVHDVAIAGRQPMMSLRPSQGMQVADRHAKPVVGHVLAMTPNSHQDFGDRQSGAGLGATQRQLEIFRHRTAIAEVDTADGKEMFAPNQRVGGLQREPAQQLRIERLIEGLEKAFRRIRELVVPTPNAVSNMHEIRKSQIGASRHPLGHHGEKIGLPEVVVVTENQPVAARRRRALGACGVGPAVALGEHGHRETTQHALRVVSRTVVDNDDLVRRQRLRQHGRQRFRQKFGPVVRRNDDAYSQHGLMVDSSGSSRRAPSFRKAAFLAISQRPRAG